MPCFSTTSPDSFEVTLHSSNILLVACWQLGLSNSLSPSAALRPQTPTSHISQVYQKSMLEPPPGDLFSHLPHEAVSLLPLYFSFFGKLMSKFLCISNLNSFMHILIESLRSLFFVLILWWKNRLRNVVDFVQVQLSPGELCGEPSPLTWIPLLSPLHPACLVWRRRSGEHNNSALASQLYQCFSVEGTDILDGKVCFRELSWALQDVWHFWKVKVKMQVA